MLRGEDCLRFLSTSGARNHEEWGRVDDARKMNKTVQISRMAGEATILPCYIPRARSV